MTMTDRSELLQNFVLWVFLDFVIHRLMQNAFYIVLVSEWVVGLVGLIVSFHVFLLTKHPSRSRSPLCLVSLS